MSKRKRKTSAGKFITCAFCGGPIHNASECIHVDNGNGTELLHRRCLKGYIVMRRVGVNAGK